MPDDVLASTEIPAQDAVARTLSLLVGVELGSLLVPQGLQVEIPLSPTPSSRSSTAGVSPSMALAAAPRRGLFDLLFCRVVNVATSSPSIARSPRKSPVRSPGRPAARSADHEQDSPSLTAAPSDRRVKVLSLRTVVVASETPASPSTALSSLREWNRNRGTSSPPPPAKLGDAWQRGDAIGSESDSRSSGVASPGLSECDPSRARPGTSAPTTTVASAEAAGAKALDFAPVCLPDSTADARVHHAQVGSDAAGSLAASDAARPSESELLNDPCGGNDAELRVVDR